MKSTTAASCRHRRNHTSDRSVVLRGGSAMQAPSLLLIASFAALHAAAGGRGDQSALASKALAVPKIDAEEQQGMHELFDDLDSDDDDRFEQKELGNMLQQFGLDSKHGAKNPWKWKDALRRMDKNEDTFLSKLEVINHMKRLVMSRRQVADWLRYSVGLPQYIQTFERNSVTGYDLPALLEGTRGGDDGPEGTAATDNDILKSELGVQSSLHRKQIKRAILNRMFGEAPHKPADFSCSPGRTAGSVQVEWEESESDLDGEDMVYRLRRQDPLTKSWVTLVDKGALLGYVDEGLPSASVVSYKLDVWSMNGGSEEMRLNGCQASGGTLTWIVGCVLDVVQRSLVDTLVLVALLTGLLVYQRSGSNSDVEVPLAKPADSGSSTSAEGLPLQRAQSEGSLVVDAGRSSTQLRASSSEPPLHRLRESRSFDAVAAYSMGGPTAPHAAANEPHSRGLGTDVGLRALRLSSTGAPPPLSQARPNAMSKIKDDYGPMKMAKKMFGKKKQSADGRGSRRR